MSATSLPPIALTIAGSDSSGGAGIQADLKTFGAFGVYGMSAVTAITSQNTQGVSQSLVLPPELVARQIRDVVSDLGCAAVKTGMLGTAEVVAAVAQAVKELALRPLVVDPVMVAKSGAPLLEDEAAEALKQQLLPLTDVLTPNLPEAERLVGRPLSSLDDMLAAAQELAALGPRAVVVKGGHRADEPTDVLWLSEGGQAEILRGPRFEQKNTHGTGCVFAAAITAGLALGLSTPVAVRKAKFFVTEAIRYGLPFGHGFGPANVLAAGLMLAL